MPWIISLLLTGAVAFTVTNTGDFLFLTLFLAETNTSFKKRHVIIGQYIGFFVLLVLSLFGSFAATMFPAEWIGLLGIYPIVKGLTDLRRHFVNWMDNAKSAKCHVYRSSFPIDESLSGTFLGPQTLSVATITVSMGADNLSVYIPLFAQVFAQGNVLWLSILLIFFLMLVGAWCFFGYVFAHLPGVMNVLKSTGSWIFPLLLIGLGIFILCKDGTLTMTISPIHASLGFKTEVR